MKYIAPEAEIILFSPMDIITTSSDSGINDDKTDPFEIDIFN
ncbi:MAG: hypothetical protein UH824_05715 [Acutalibacteraceae bacterium]|nr:hypothetical protein [Acutalibacteraceae bacterium]